MKVTVKMANIHQICSLQCQLHGREHSCQSAKDTNVRDMANMAYHSSTSYDIYGCILLAVLFYFSCV